MSSDSLLIKQIASVRRKPGLTRKEFLDHHFRIHGAIADGTDDLDSKPTKYMQTHVFDSAYGGRQGGIPNANHAWIGRDDVTELYFRDWDHIVKVLSSQYTKDNVGPDAVQFADFETTTVVMAHEYPVQLKTRLATQRSVAPPLPDWGSRTVAILFVAHPDGRNDGFELHESLTPLLARALETHATDAVWGLFVNVGVTSDKVNPTDYFGGATMPKYALVYKIVMQDDTVVREVREAQAEFVAQAGDQVDQDNSYILFGREGLILDVERGQKLTKANQPIMRDLAGPSHLDG